MSATAHHHLQQQTRELVGLYERQAYLINEDANLPPPRRTGPQRLKFLGWRRDPTLTITQPDPLPLTVLAVKTEVLW